MRRHVLAGLLASGLLGGCTGALHAQTANLEPASILPPTAEGDWVRTDTNGSGNFGALTSSFTPAELTPIGKSTLAALSPPPPRQETRTKTGAVVTNPTPCIYNGGQLTMEYDSEGFHAVKTKNEFVFVQERGSDRHVYLNRTGLPDASTRTPTSSGFSTGVIEPDGTLVVRTTDMTQARVTAGGIRTPQTIVQQRYVPSADGKHLEIQFSWIDPVLYAKPHRYTYTFDRQVAGAYALDDFCDATDPLEGQSIVPPAQVK